MSYLSNSHRKFAAAALTAALVVSAVVPVSAATYTDVSDRYKEAVDFLVEGKVTDGLTATTFGTDKAIKRADAAVLLAKAAGFNVENVEDSGFTDVPDRAKKYIDALKQNGIVNGKTTTSFASDQSITRGEVALMLSKAFNLEARKTSAKFTDVAPRYQAAVDALLENKVTNGKTDTSFGTDQAITRGEFAIFLYNLSIVPIPEVKMPVSSESELKDVLGNPDVKEIVLLENITAQTLPVIERNVKIDLNGKVLTGSLEYKDYTSTETVELVSSVAGGKLQGDLTIDAPKSDFVVGKNVEVTGKTTIINVKENTLYNNGVLNSVDIKDNDGVSFANQESGSIVGTVALNTTGNVKLIGKLDSVEVNQAAKITVDAAASINKLNVKAANVVLNAPAGSVNIVEAAPGVVVKDPSGSQIETQPANGAVQPSPPTEPTQPSQPVPDSSTEAEKLKSSINAKLDVMAPAVATLLFKNVSVEKLRDLENALPSNGVNIGTQIAHADFDGDGEVSEDEFGAFFGSLPANTFSGENAKAKLFKALQAIYGNKALMDKVILEINQKIQAQAPIMEYLDLKGVTLEKLTILNDALPSSGLPTETLFVKADQNKNGSVDQGEFAAYIGNLPPDAITGDSTEAKVFKALQNFYGNALVNKIYTINMKFEVHGLAIEKLKFEGVTLEKIHALNEAMPFSGLNFGTLVSDADTDKSGEVSEEELASFVRSLPEDSVTGDSKEAKVLNALKAIYSQ